MGLEQLSTKTKLLIALVLGAVAIIIGILVESFADVGYDMYGFKRRRSTGNVDTNKVYTPGRYMLGPDYEFKKFQKTAHFVKLSDLVYSKDKLEVRLTVNFQYFLREEDLKILHDTYNLEYGPVLESNAMVAVKGTTPLFTIWEFIVDRAKVEKKLFEVVRERLGGNCCEYECTLRDDCIPGCKERSLCKDEDKGLFAKVKYFQLGRIEIPSEVEARHLKAHVETEQIEKAQYEQDAKVVEKQTEKEVQDIQNEAQEIKYNAEAQASLTRDRAQFEAEKLKEQARSNGLKTLYTKLGLTEEQYMTSFDYLRSIRGNDKIHLNVDLGQIDLLINTDRN